MSAELLFVALAALFAGLDAVRRHLARRALDEAGTPPPAASEADVTVLQPILGGDPALADTLAATLAAAPEAGFVWLLDEDDAAGLAAAEAALARTGHARVTRLVAPRPPAGVNPKTHKLAAGAATVTTPWLAVLDDDTVPGPGAFGRLAALAGPDTLATGLPVYHARSTPLARLVTGFVNGRSAVTYLPAARLGRTRTINGMISTMRTADLARRGGFAAIVHEVTDDYALARLFLDRGGRIRQAAEPVAVATSVRDLGHYVALQRRWMVFARLYLAENPDPAILALVVLPEILILPLVASAGLAGPLALAGLAGLLLARAYANRSLLFRLTGRRAPILDPVFEILADLLAPLHAAAALVAPNRIRWRSRTLTLDGRRIADG